jgi:hypothetical protein
VSPGGGYAAISGANHGFTNAYSANVVSNGHVFHGALYQAIGRIYNRLNEKRTTTDWVKLGLGIFHTIEGAGFILTGIFAPIGITVGAGGVPGFGAPAGVAFALSATPALIAGGVIEVSLGYHHLREFFSGNQKH